MKKDITLVLAFTPNYLVPAATCLLSILEHSSKTETFHVICLLTEALSEKKAQQLAALDSKRLSFTFLDLSGKLDNIYVDERYTVAASYRLLLPELLADYQKVIYIDCDVIVRNDLAKLYREIDLADYYIAGVFEATLEFQELYIMSIGCVPGQYINSGFLVMNLKQLRDDNMVPKFLKAAQKEGLQFPDQDVINQLCQGRILGLPPYYNAIRTYFLPQYKRDFLKYYTEGDWEAVQQHGTVHYTGGKPWNSFTVMFKLWWSYFEKLPRDMKHDYPVDKKIYRLYKMYSSSIGSFVIDSVMKMFRKLKYK